MRIAGNCLAGIFCVSQPLGCPRMDSLRTVYIRKVTRSRISKDNRKRFNKKLKPYRNEGRDSST
jgi:hypothetical protein